MHTVITVHIPHAKNTPYALGRHYEHDERSEAFTISAPPVSPKTIFWSDAAPILNQGSIGGCVGWTGADILNTDMFKPVRDKFNKGQYFTDADGLRFYELATRCDSIPGNYPPDDTGSSGLGLAKALTKLGLIDKYEHGFGMDHLFSGIMTQPIAMGTLWTNDMFNPDSEGIVHVGQLTDSNIAGGHEWMLRGIDMERELGLARNHWAANWDTISVPGDNFQKSNGEFWIPLSDIEVLIGNNADITLLHGTGMP
jgi:hypothetical protein